jgi:hypothetical protein
MTKLEIGDVDDPLEHEADQIADRVMQMKSARAAPNDEPSAAMNPTCTADSGELRRACASCSANDDGIHRPCASCESEEEEELRREPGAGQRGGQVSDAFATQLRGRVNLGGSPLSLGVRRFLEPRLGVELSTVRVHADAEAGFMARQVGARAFTFGQHIFFSPGQLQPHSQSGMRLIAHEVVHALQARELHRLQRTPVEQAEEPSSSGPCTDDPIEESELRKADRDGYRKLLQRWLTKVADKDLRFDLLRSIRARRARRACLAASCGREGFTHLLHDVELKNKLACFDEAHYGGNLRGICAERLGARCAVGTPPPAASRRQRLTEKAVKLELANRGLSSKPGPDEAYQKLGQDSVLVAELVRAQHRLEYALGQTRILAADYQATLVPGAKTKLARRSRATRSAFEKEFGSLTPAKLETLLALLDKTLKIMERGWNLDDFLNQGDGGTTTSNVAPAPQADAANDDQTEDVSEQPVYVNWRPEDESDCTASGGYRYPGKIAVCVDPYEDATDLMLTKYRSTVLHEFFHEAINSTDLDVYHSSPLYSVIKYLESDEYGVFALRNPDSLTNFVLVAANVRSGEAGRAMPDAALIGTRGEPSCENKQVMLALGMTYELLRRGETDDADRVAYYEMTKDKSVEVEAENAARRLEVIRSAMAKLSKAGNARNDLMSSNGAVTLSNERSRTRFVPVPKVEVYLIEKSPKINITKKGAMLMVTIGRAFLNQSLLGQMEMVMMELSKDPSLFEFLSEDIEDYPEYQIVKSAKFVGCKHPETGDSA